MRNVIEQDRQMRVLGPGLGLHALEGRVASGRRLAFLELGFPLGLVDLVVDVLELAADCGRNLRRPRAERLACAVYLPAKELSNRSLDRPGRIPLERHHVAEQRRLRIGAALNRK